MFKEFLNYVWLFFLFGFLGWAMEVGFAAVRSRRFVNRGFNNGPICPIYGVGIVAVWLPLQSLRGTWILLFVASVFVTSAVELVTGFLMDKIFHNKWWDYSKEKCNIGGYICLRFSLIWGILCTVLIQFAVPVVLSIVSRFPTVVDVILLAVMTAILMFDTVMSILAVHGFNRTLGILARRAEELHSDLHEGSDIIGEKVYKGAIKVSTGYDELSVKALNGAARLLDAFPTMKSERYNEQLLNLREKLTEMRRKNDSRVESDKKRDEENQKG